MLRPDYPIRTARLVLRPFQEDDLDVFHAYRSLPEVHRYLYNDTASREGVAELLARRINEHELTEEGQRLALAVCLDEEVIGDVALKWTNEANRQGEIGYSLHPAFQGKGYAQEAAAHMLKLGFEDLGLHRIQAECDARNEPSWRVMERLNMRREAHLRHHELFKGEWGDSYVYAMLAEEYREPI
ncbi:acetyltransferase [Lentzea aerocolonigenes]|uniref:Acetyltransferase n=1 Tax=Lentzea aerocolonigenes TaxID=68170 RepID=A0A0F0H197_LENAE|nr:GNAT family protein [Lentzea aerocolonigenes]KJK49355.1 acetyltransferase [Lentzea aerocolonigenes]